MALETKFRAFQLDSPGSLFSYYKSNHYTLIEARIPKGGLEVLINDVKSHNKTTIDCLHITSWDDDHCEINALTQIINHLRPTKIQIPSYEPTSDIGKSCKTMLTKYDAIHDKFIYNVKIYTKDTISNLPNGEDWGTNPIAYHSLYNVANKNDMSQIRLFRSAGFNVLSLGDCESEEITNYLLKQSFIGSEVDVLILPHHGSEQSCLNSDLLDFCKPSLTVCSSNYDNEYEHPRESVTKLLANKGVKNMTTKRGDIIVIKDSENQHCVAHNLVSNNQNIEESFKFSTKRSQKK